ncbi:hypothetical protein BXT86_01215 [candidate division WOR-3 bacterium 4484_100]|uniref:Uncharacterized protein n=1 Tax=candidate division WOR-3 bacterium 4484_100 TaxID=1936077 RepID=A0A1V4QI91_UNCW3|nr:MAG: hypothetical protein BXT86_01215 [candidate division WOR-3 bacterium 4484_100]
MKVLKYVSLILAIICIILGIIARLFLPGKILFGLAALTYLRLTIMMLLFALTFHFFFSEG